MHIANPIYDVVFKYLMEDQEIATLIISTIMGEEIVELTFLPQESTITLEYRSLTVYRLDFSAKIKKPDNTYKQVIIEIQKAKFAADIMRFRRYVGEQYRKKENSYMMMVDGQETRRAMPIVSIYFLGYQLEHTTAPVIKVTRKYYDATTGEELHDREEFIESLTHESYVIQIPHLRPEHRTDVERLLSIFDQHYVTADTHVLQVKEHDFPGRFQRVVRRLQCAIAEPEVQRTMDAEDDILEELQELERSIERKDKALREKEQALQEKNQALQEKDKLIEELRARLESEQ